MTFSIIAPVFNHKDFIAEFLDSILAQDFSDFELILIDDFSSDSSCEIIESHLKNNIYASKLQYKLIKHEFNKGINSALHSGFLNASGDYLIFIAGDDKLKPSALKILFNALNYYKHIDCFYVQLDFIAKDSSPLPSPHLTPQQNRYEILHEIFMKQNCLGSPGMCMKKSAFANIYPLTTSMANLQDVEMHVRLAINGEVMVLKDRLIDYRINHGTNISMGDMALRRDMLETTKLMDNFLKINDCNFLEKIFELEINKSGIHPKSGALEFFFAQMALMSENKERKFWGYKKLMDSFDNDEKLLILKQNYNFCYKDYLSFASILSLKQHKQNEKYKIKTKKYKKLFNAALSGLIIAIFIIIFLIFKGI